MTLERFIFYLNVFIGALNTILIAFLIHLVVQFGANPIVVEEPVMVSPAPSETPVVVEEASMSSVSVTATPSPATRVVTIAPEEVTPASQE